MEVEAPQEVLRGLFPARRESERRLPVQESPPARPYLLAPVPGRVSEEGAAPREVRAEILRRGRGAAGRKPLPEPVADVVENLIGPVVPKRSREPEHTFGKGGF